MASSGTGARVLVIDDSNTIRRCAEMFLSQAGYNVILAENGFEALALIDREQPDLIFVDILMPRLDGYNTCALIKRNRRHASTPIVMMSAKDNMFDRAHGRLVGAHGHLTKPFTKEALLGAASAELSRLPRSIPSMSAPRLRLELHAA